MIRCKRSLRDRELRVVPNIETYDQGQAASGYCIIGHVYIMHGLFSCW